MSACGKELEGNGAVDGNVAADAEAYKGDEDAQGSKGRRCTGRNAKDACDEAGEVEGPLASHDVDTDAPREGAHCEADVERRREGADVLCAGSKAIRLVLERYEDEAKGLCPEEVDEEAEATKEEDEPLCVGRRGSAEVNSCVYAPRLTWYLPMPMASSSALIASDLFSFADRLSSKLSSHAGSDSSPPSTAAASAPLAFDASASASVSSAAL